MLRKKCKSTSGASILIALFFLLLCATVGSVILSAASTSSGRLSNLKNNEQSYYAVSSAAKLLRKEIEGEKYSRYEIFSDSNQTLTGGYYKIPERGMKDLLIKAADQVFESESPDFSYSDTLIIETSETTIEEVTAKFTMDTQYNITVELSQGNTVCTLSIPVVLSEKEEEVIVDNEELAKTEKGIRKTLTLTWTEGSVK